MAKLHPGASRPVKSGEISTTNARGGEIRGRGRMLRVLVVSLALALVAMAVLLYYFYSLP